MKAANLDLADSALHAPAAGFGETEFYPKFVDKAAVVIVRLAKNHPLPDGNKRAAWVALRMFVEINGWSWSQRPSIDETEQAVLAICSRVLIAGCRRGLRCRAAPSCGPRA
jgi:death-on-curing protein